MAVPIHIANLQASLARHRAAVIAFRNADGTLTNKTFASLHDDSQRAQRYLRGLGLGKGARVGILADNCYQWLVLDVACIELGIILVAFSHETIDGGIADLFRRYSLAVLFSDRELPHTGTHPVRDLCAIGAEQPVPLPNVEQTQPAPEDHFSISFSSGTTGIPKGMVVSRAGLDFLLHKIISAFALVPQDGIYIFLPLSNFQQRLVFYAAVLAGANAYFTTTTYVLSDFAHFGPTFFVAPPVLFSNILTLFDLQKDGGRSLRDMLGGNIRFILVGMAPAERRTLERFHEHGVPLLEVYGLSEVGTIAWNTVEHCRIGTVGLPVDSAEIHFSDDQEILVRRTTPLCVAYLTGAGEPGAEETFRADGLIATGDIGYLDDGNYLVLTGRKKNIVITTSGHKYQPEQLERRLNAMDLVNSALVYHSQQHQANFAIINVSRKTADTLAALQQQIDQLNTTLPAYQKISRILVNDAAYTVANNLLTANLKLNRSKIIEEYAI